eukprot:scaffold59175_cov36-Cyclotella_meneghiniana.AAC.1
MLRHVKNFPLEKHHVLLKSLVDYKEKHGHANVPLRDAHLGNFVAACRRQYKAGTISKSLKEELDNIDFDWVLDTSTQWEKSFQELIRFKSLHDHCNVGRAHGEEFKKLKRWVSAQRSDKLKLSNDRVRRLDEIGFVWKAERGRPTLKEELDNTDFDLVLDTSTQWEKSLQELIRFKSLHDHCNVGRAHGEEFKQLKRWVSAQRSDKLKLSFDKVRRLDEIGFVWKAQRGRPTRK